MEIAKEKYNTRLKSRLADLTKINQQLKDIQVEIDKDKAEINQDKAEIEIQDQKLRNILNKVTTQDIQTKEQIKNLVIKTKMIFKKY